jgi:hypothetical protein
MIETSNLDNFILANYKRLNGCIVSKFICQVGYKRQLDKHLITGLFPEITIVFESKIITSTKYEHKIIFNLNTEFDIKKFLIIVGKINILCKKLEMNFLCCGMIF